MGNGTMKTITFTEEEFRDIVSNLSSNDFTPNEKYKMCMKTMGLEE